MIKKRKLSHKAGYFFKAELLFSNAYVDLPKSARDLLHCLTFELKYVRNKNSKRFSYINNGKVSFTETQFKKEFGCASNTYITARNRLIRNGLIKQTYKGGYGPGDRATYKILITPDLNPKEIRWLEFPKKNWESEIPRNNTQIGVETRFKSKITLEN